MPEELVVHFCEARREAPGRASRVPGVLAPVVMLRTASGYFGSGTGGTV
jgi:hypothetical protein